MFANKHSKNMQRLFTRCTNNFLPQSIRHRVSIHRETQFAVGLSHDRKKNIEKNSWPNLFKCNQQNN